MTHVPSDLSYYFFLHAENRYVLRKEKSSSSDVNQQSDAGGSESGASSLISDGR